MSDTPPPPPPPDAGWNPQSSATPGMGDAAHAGAQPGKGWAAVQTGGTVELATPLRRLLARILDSIIIFVAMGVVAATSIFGEDSIDIGAQGALTLLLLLIVGILYEVTLIALRGQTLGKMALGVRVVGADNGQNPGWGKASLRWLTPNAPAILPLVGSIITLLVYLSLLWSDTRQGWHDMAAKTLVIKA